MSEPENFLSRWSRRKQQAELADERDTGSPPEAVQESLQESRQEAPTVSAAESPADPAKESVQKPDTEFDVSSLPSIDSIGVGTDVRAFLQRGVPAELTRAALRRAWTSDPAIRDFIEVAENQWDFAAATDLPGFGPLLPSDNVQQLVAEVFKAPAKAVEAVIEAPPQEVETEAKKESAAIEPQESAAPIASDPVETDTVPPETDTVVVQRENNNDALQQEGDIQDEHPPVRSHGGALPS